MDKILQQHEIMATYLIHKEIQVTRHVNPGSYALRASDKYKEIQKTFMKRDTEKEVISILGKLLPNERVCSIMLITEGGTVFQKTVKFVGGRLTLVDAYRDEDMCMPAPEEAKEAKEEENK